MVPIRLSLFVGLLSFLGSMLPASAVIRDGGVDPNNLGQGGWLYILNSSTNRLGGTVDSVTDINSMFAYLKGQGMNYVIVKAGTSNMLFSPSGGNVPINSPNAQFNTSLVNSAHANGLLIFGSIRSWGNDIPGEIAVGDYVFQQGADGFIIDAESEWESNQPWIGANGPALAWQYGSTLRAHWPNKFIAHNPYDTLYLHSSFPFREFGYWCDVVMPQVYHHAASQGNAIAAIHWTDVNYKKFQDSLYTMAPSVINGQTIYWTNALKPLVLMRDVYNSHPDQDVANFLDYLVADPNCVTAGGYQGSDYFRSELHTPGQWANIKSSTIGRFPGVVNNIIMDDANATVVGPWTMVKTIDATTSTVIFSGATGSDINSFGTNYWSIPQGTGANYIQFNPPVVTAGEYILYQWHPTRSDGSGAAPINFKYDGGVGFSTANLKTNDGNWAYFAKLWFAAGTNNYIRFYDNVPDAGAVALVDGIKMTFVPPVTVPPTPFGLTASAVSTNRINLSWLDQSTNETGFVIFRSTTNGGPYTAVGSVTRNVTSFADSNLNAATTYYYVLRATNYLGLSNASAQKSATTQVGTPVPPTVVTQPQSQSVTVGTDATFSVVANGSASLSYQWQLNGANLLGSTTATCNITNAQPSDAGSYSVVITNAYGAVASSNALLTISFISPAITSQPQSQNVYASQSTAFTVSATGSGPLVYQWRANGTNIIGATSVSLAISNVTVDQAGNYSVVVTNGGGSVVSSNATLSVTPLFKAAGWTKLWSQGGGSQNYLASSGQTERGIAYNPVSNRVLLVSRTAGNRIVVLNGDTGAYLHDLALSGSVTGGTYPILMVGVGGDGAVYVGNLSAANTTPFRLYRWASDNPETLPTVAFSGDPGAGNNQRWGDTLAVRGSGTNTQVILASRNGTMVSVLTTPDGTNFVAHPIDIPGVDAGAFGLGISFGFNNTFWGKSANLPLRQVSFDLVNNTATVSRNHSTSEFPGMIAPIGVEPSLNLLVGINTSSPDNLQLFDLRLDNSAPSWIATTNFGTANSNPFSCGGLAFVGQRVYALDSNNGLMAMQILETPTAPGISTQPLSQTVNQGGNVTFSVSVTGTAPFDYQWKWNGTNISSATLSSFTITNVQPSDVGNYAVVVTNAGGTTNSVIATLAVNSAPVLTTQPVSQIVNLGADATFTALASGTGPLVYQWRLNGTNLSTGTSLTIQNAQTQDAGVYTVVVSNFVGSIISSNAVLNVKSPALLRSPAVSPDGHLHLLLSGDAGSSYTIERSTNLIQWDPITNLVFTNETIEVIDPNATNFEKAFYRARE